MTVKILAMLLLDLDTQPLTIFTPEVSCVEGLHYRMAF